VQYKTYTVDVVMRMWRKDTFESIEELAEICKDDWKQYKAQVLSRYQNESLHEQVSQRYSVTYQKCSVN